MLRTVVDTKKAQYKDFAIIILTIIITVVCYCQDTKCAKGLSQRHWPVPRGSRSLEAQALGSGPGHRQCSFGHGPVSELGSWWSQTWQVRMNSPSSKSSSFAEECVLVRQTLMFKNKFL